MLLPKVNRLRTQSVPSSHLNSRERGDLGAGGDHDVLGLDGVGDAPVRPQDGHLVLTRDLPVALQVLHLRV